MAAAKRGSSATRPSVSVVVPFKGDATAALRLLSTLEKIEVRDGDELLAVDNTRDGSLLAVATEARVRVIHATDEASSYYARNVGAEAAGGEWILFTDADCRPRPTILDDYFANPVAERCGALGGEVVGAEEQTSLLARFARARRSLDQSGHLDSSVRRFAGTANLLVRREAWRAVGGFCEGIRTGGDQDFSWRLQDRGWTIEYAGQAIVEHLHRERLGELLEQSLRYGTAVAWLGRRHPQTYRRAPVARSVGGAARILLRAAVSRSHGGEPRAFAALDGLTAGAFALGPLIDNRARRNRPEPEPRALALVDTLDAASVDPSTTHVEARRRDVLPQPWLVRHLEVSYGEDDGELRNWFDLVWLGATHPRLTGSVLLRGGGRLRELHAVAPAARRLARAVKAGVRWQVAPARRADAELVARVLGASEAPHTGSAVKASARTR